MSVPLLPSSLMATARQVVEANAAAGRTVAVAESCTGGLVCAALTEVPGASSMFEAGYVTYSDQVKIDALGVDPAIIARWGAVSLQTAEAMARGALSASGANVAVSITGIAGPDGGSLDKPVGTVVFALANADTITSEQRLLDASEGRSSVRLQAALYALGLLLP